MFSAKNPKKNDVVANCKKKVCPTYCCSRVLLAFCQQDDACQDVDDERLERTFFDLPERRFFANFAFYISMQRIINRLRHPQEDSPNGRKQTIYSLGKEIPSGQFPFRRGAEGLDGNPEECGIYRTCGPGLPFLRPSRSRKDFLRAHFRKDAQLPEPHA